MICRLDLSKEKGLSSPWELITKAPHTVRNDGLVILAGTSEVGLLPSFREILPAVASVRLLQPP